MEKRLIIIDCSEDFFKLYEPLYKKLAKHQGFDLDKVFVVTDKSIHVLKPTKDFYTPYENTYFLINIGGSRITWLLRLFDHKKIMNKNICLFEHYTTLYHIPAHPICAEILRNSKENDIYAVTEFIPSKKYQNELNYILEDFLNAK